MSIYLDYNASTPVDNRVLNSMIAAYKEYFGNADSRTHDFGVRAKKSVEEARKQVASLLKVDSNEVIFASGATEANNIAILGLAEFGIQTGKKHIITTSIEHKAILEPIKTLEPRGFETEYVSPDSSGRIDIDKLLSKIRPDTLLVSIMHANNETGIIQPVQEIGIALKDKDVFFHIDAAQSCGKLVEELQTCKYDMLSLTAHKMYGPQGIGALILRRKNYKIPPVKPITFGGGHEGGIRPGTLPVALIVGLGKACEIAEKEHEADWQKYILNKKIITNGLDNSKVQFEINGDPNFCLPNTLNVSFIGVDSEALMIASKQYCSVSNGSACTSNDYSPSHVLVAMGLPDSRVNSAIRLSWGKEPVDKASTSRFFETIYQFI